MHREQTLLDFDPALAEQPATTAPEAPQGRGVPHSCDARLHAMREQLSSFSREYRLSAREREILSALAEGTHPKAIASQLGASYATVRTHLHRMSKKLGCSGSRELITKFFTVALSQDPPRVPQE